MQRVGPSTPQENGGRSAAGELKALFENHTAVVGVIGLGYVGLPLAVEAARSGYRTIGFDVSERVVDGVNQGESHIADVPEDVVRAFVGELAEHRPHIFGMEPEYGSFRAADVRHSQASIEEAQARLVYAPGYRVEEGLREVLDWYATVAPPRTRTASSGK